MKKVVLLLLLLSTISCQKQDDPIPEFSLEQADQMTADEYQVYSTILEKYSQPQLIVRQQTSVYTPPKENFELFFELEKMANMETVLYSRYVEANVSSYLLDEKIEIPAKEINVMSNQEYAYYFERDNLYEGWHLFNTRYPNSGAWFFSLNKIGFNQDGNQAIVGIESYWFMESPDGPVLKSGMLIYLEKKNEVWEQVGSASYPL